MLASIASPPHCLPLTSILFWHPEHARYREALARRLPHASLAIATDEPAFARCLPEADVLFGFQFPAAALAPSPRLRWIHVTSAGAEFLMPLRDRLAGVAVTNTRGIHGAPIAEYVMAAMTLLHSDFPGFFRAQQARHWERRGVGTLQGRTLVVVGLGAIGSEIAARASAFGMRVVGVSQSGSPVTGCERVVVVAQMEGALADADFVAVAIPLTEATRGLLGARAFAALKPGARLVNVARGGVVDEDALLAALRSGTLAGACLDVFAQEPLPPGHPFWSLRNVIVTPHIAGYREDYVERALDVFVDNLARFEAGTPLRNAFDLARGY